MKNTIFDFKNYKEYLVQWIEKQPQKGRGERSRMAEALSCQLAYVSQVLNGDLHFSFEQSESLNEFLGHSEEEADFFLLLVHRERAGTPALEKRIQKKIDHTLNQRLVLKNRIVHEKTLSAENQMTYYSAWYYSVVHMAIAIPGLQSRDAISKAIRLSPQKVSKVIEFLVNCGLVQESKGKYQIGNARIHLGADSPMITKLHTNWRMEAIKSLDRDDPSELHYSSLVTIAEKDIPKVREVLVKAIEGVREIVRPSKDEKLVCYTLDLFKVGE